MKSSYLSSGRLVFARAFRVIFRLVAVAAFIGIMAQAGCEKEEKEITTDRVRKILTSATWKIQSVAVDGADKTSSFVDHTLKFTSTHFTAVNGDPVWPASGIWTFADDTGNKIVRDDDIEVSVNEINANKLVLSLMWTKTTLGAGRLSSISGEHVFTFVK
jgi:hypothetical protein